jgi:hypothetical protein
MQPDPLKYLALLICLHQQPTVKSEGNLSRTSSTSSVMTSMLDAAAMLATIMALALSARIG